jgi:predicted amidohydrolase
MPKRKTLKVAAIQAASVGFDLDSSLRKLEKLTTEAAVAGAELVVFPYVLMIFFCCSAMGKQ